MPKGMVTNPTGKGGYKPGQSGNPAGRPKREVEQAYLNATISKVSLDDWGKVIEKALLQAIDGDGEARKWLSEYILGKPTQRTEITGADGGPVAISDARAKLESLINTAAANSAAASDPGESV